ncbi:MAG: response regulator transcription factor [Armatimonadota bacterium]|nr:response regulator transcription factor [Armatimonadota bacterium]MDR7422404.1 response regulator transcription factor [Armatimonadota bacterium]MDR7453962.1 response regulator transcription factor [Armatimonadota bacterium]MDR7457166.1 response regulator transcription factor [Armatimonadota bacterium]MDR7497982.1 response regulator transcription factor [Armatimonadota bacterium]
MSPTVLVVEDDARITNLLRLYLEREGYGVVAAHDGREALEAAARGRPSLVILDLMLPHLDGVEVCRRLRETSDVPILMLTARVDEIDRLLGLSLGADDYVTKPFSPREVVARVKAILRRASRQAPGRVLRHRELELDLERHRAAVRGAEVHLTPIEFKLLRAFLEAPERAFSREQLLDRIYAYHEADVVDRTIDVHVGKLREKLGDDPASPRYIATVRGVGYKLL